MTDKISDWYSIIGKSDKKLVTTFKPNSTYKTHYIDPCSMIMAVGGTGSGKSTALLEFLKRTNDTFHKVIIFSGSSTDEPIFNYIENKFEEHVEMYEDIEELPSLNEDKDTKHQKLIVFDDFINLPKKDFRKINEYLTAGRKKGYTVFLMAQNYVSVPKIITRNLNYLIIFKINDNVSINTIIKNHNVTQLSAEEFKDIYTRATAVKPNFLLIDMKTTIPRLKLRQNFLNFIS